MFCTFCLSSFLLDDNDLNGTMPSELGNLSNLKKLSLGKCLELVFHSSLMEFVRVFVVLLEVGLIELILMSVIRMITKHGILLTHTHFFLVSMYYWVK